MRTFFCPDPLLRVVRTLGLPTVVVQEGGCMVEALGPGLTALMEGLGV